MNRIQFTLCGSLGPDDALNPYRICEPPARQEILHLINVRPMAPDALAAQTGRPEEEIRDDLALLRELGYVVEEPGWRSHCPVVDEPARAEIGKMVQRL